MHLSLAKLTPYVINLDRSRDRWLGCHQLLSNIFANRIVRVPGFDGIRFTEQDCPPGTPEAKLWKQDLLMKFQTEGLAGRKHIPDPVRLALCMSHQRALTSFLSSGEPWGVIFEDDAKPTRELYENVDPDLIIEIPDDAELVFLHSRVRSRHHAAASSAGFTARTGIGLEAQLVNRIGAAKMLEAFRPMVVECDVQLMTFAEDYAERHQRDKIWRMLRENGKTSFRTIKAYGFPKPLFQVDASVPSVKLQILSEAKTASASSPAANPGPAAAGFVRPHQEAAERGPLLELRPGLGLGFAVCYFNPARYRSRLDNFIRFAENMEALGKAIVVVELAAGDDPFELPPLLPNMIRVRSQSVLWHKECLLNAGMAHLAAAGFENVGWLDADTLFPDEEWHSKVNEVLKTRRLCQVFEQSERSFPDVGRQRVAGVASDWMARALSPSLLNNTGYGWAMKREVWEEAGLFEFGVVGGGDYLMWRALFSNYLERTAAFSPHPDYYSPGFGAALHAWAAKWSSAVGLSLGYPARVLAKPLPHGRMADRRYTSRDNILKSYAFDPEIHLRRTAGGLLQWSPAAPDGLVDAVRQYFFARKEDAGYKVPLPQP